MFWVIFYFLRCVVVWLLVVLLLFVVWCPSVTDGARWPVLSLAAGAQICQHTGEGNCTVHIMESTLFCILQTALHAALHAALYAALYAALHAALYAALHAARCAVCCTVRCMLHAALYAARCTVRCMTLPPGLSLPLAMASLE